MEYYRRGIELRGQASLSQAEQSVAYLALGRFDDGIRVLEQAIEASHVFNLLQARGVISVAERQAYIGRVRDLAKGACQAWMEKNGWAA